MRIARLLATVSAREARGRRGRSSLLLGAVATGVALIVAVGLINTSVLASFRRTFDALAGPADLEVTLGSGEVAFDEAVVDVLRGDPAVVAAVPMVRGTVALADEPGEALQLFGAELTAENDFARYGVHLTTARREALSALEDPHAVLLSEKVASRLGVAVGGSLQLATPHGVDTFTVRGLIAPTGLAAALAGQLVVMDLAAAQTQLAKEGRIDQFDVALAAGIDVEPVRSRLAAALPPGFAIGPPGTRASRYADILGGLQTTLAGMSVMCTGAGLAVIYNGISASMVHRMGALATMRLLGAEGPTLFRLVVAETLLLGLTGSVLGAGVGILLGRLLLGLVGQTMGTMIQMRFVVPDISVDWLAVLGAIGVGTATAVLASWVPARQAMWLDPLHMAKGHSGHRPNAARALAIWVVLAGIGLAGVFGGGRLRDGALIMSGATLWYLSIVAVAIPFVMLASVWALRWLPRLFGMHGRLAAESLEHVPVRAGMTVAAIAYVFAIAVTLAAVIESYVLGAREFIAEVHDGDLVVSAVATEGGWLETPVGPDVPEAIADLEGVARVESARVLSGHHFRTGRVGILALEPDAFLRFGTRLWRAGDLARARAALAAGDGVAVSTVFAQSYGTRVGDDLVVETPSGPLALPVVGIVADMSSGSGAIVVGRRRYAEAWRDPTVNRINVFLESGASLDTVTARIRDALGERHRLKIHALADTLAYIDDKIREAFMFSRSLQLLIVIVAVASIFDLLLARIHERRRELAVWRVAGADDRAVRRTLLVESLTLAVAACLLGFPFGVATAWLWVRRIIPSLVGYDIPLAVPVLPCLATVVVVVVATTIAGRTAAASATRTPILDGLRTD